MEERSSLQLDEGKLWQKPGPHDRLGCLLTCAAAQASLFDALLRFAAETDWLSGPDAPTIFVVYAHDLVEYGSARQEVVRQIIDWLIQIRARVLSDRSPLDGRADFQREKAVGDILDNQFCLFPVDMSQGGGNPRGDIVDKVVVCGSQVLEKYCRDPYSVQYMDSIERAFHDGETGDATEVNCEEVSRCEERIRRVVEANAKQPNFHHVLTELALLSIRKQRAKKREHGIVSVSLDEQDMTYLSFLDNCDLYLKPGDETVTSLHKFFFKLLQQLYPRPECQILATRMRQIYETALDRFQKADILEEARWGGIISDEMDKLLSSLTQDASSSARFWKDRTRGEFRT